MKPILIGGIGVALAAVAMVLAASPGKTLEIRFQPVAENVYAHIGDTGPRTLANEGLNANVGLVVTPAGAVLIDSGSTYRVAAAIDDAARRVTRLPVRWVINTGGQDHRWLGNGYFTASGAEVIGHMSAIADMNSRGGDQLAALRTLLGERAERTVAVLPSTLIDGSRATRDIGGTIFEFRHAGGGHTPGDMMVWLPGAKVLFAGDIVYVDRLPAVLPVSNTSRWLSAFDVIEQLSPRRIVPGHGGIASLERARAHTRDYLAALRAHMKRSIDEGVAIDASVKSFDATQFRSLPNADQLMGVNSNRVYLEIERE